MNNDRTPPRIHGRRRRIFNFRPVQPRRIGKKAIVLAAEPTLEPVLKPVEMKPSPATVRAAIQPIPKPVAPLAPRRPTPIKPVVKKPTLTDYRSGSIDDVLLKITTIEAEGSESSQSIVDTPNPIMPMSTLQVTKKLKKRRRFSPRIAIAVIAGIILLGVAGYIAYDTFRTNAVTKEKVAAAQAGTDGAAVLGEGEDESEVAASAVDSYTAAADAPRVLSIDKLGVRARVLPMGVNADGAVQAPINIFDSGWYTGSAKPGTKGAGLIDAHASGATRQGLFAYLDTLKNGDKLTIERGDGEVLTYSVVHVETVNLEKVDMRELLQPYEGVEEGLNLITCTGSWVTDKNTYDKRVLVYTERV